MRDRTFGPTVLLGLAGATLAAVAAARDWATSRSLAGGVAASDAATGLATGSEVAPLALALALVDLAAWGAVLVLRGRVRNVVSLLGLLASAGVLAAVVDAFDSAPGAAGHDASAAGATGDAFTTSLTGWYWATAIGATLCLAAFAVGVRRASGWPAMGTRYDAPTTRVGSSVGASPDADRDLWRVLDEGHDPTA